MTQPIKREQLAAMRIEDFKAHLRTIAGEDPKTEVTGASRPHPLLVRNRKKAPARVPKRRKRPFLFYWFFELALCSCVSITLPASS